MFWPFRLFTLEVVLPIQIRNLTFRRGQTGALKVLTTDHPSVLISAQEIFLPVHVKRGAVLMGWHHGNEPIGEPCWTVYNGGYYHAVRALAAHIPGSLDREESEILVARTVLDEAVELTWCLASSSPKEQKERYELLMRSLARWRRPRLKTKRLAMATVAESSSLRDRRGRFNPTSRSPMVLSAGLRLRRRGDDLVSIRGDVQSRLAALVSEKRRAWEFLDANDRMLRQTRSRWRDGRPPSRHMALEHARRLADAMSFCDDPYMAPFGRRTFQRLKQDFRRIADALLEGWYDDAKGLVDMSRNSIHMMRRRADMEDALLKLTQLVEAGEESFQPGESGDFFVALYGFKKSFEPPDLEHGFVRKVSLKVLEHLDAAIAEIKKPHPHLIVLRDHLKQACEPI